MTRSDAVHALRVSWPTTAGGGWARLEVVHLGARGEGWNPALTTTVALGDECAACCWGAGLFMRRRFAGGLPAGPGLEGPHVHAHFQGPQLPFSAPLCFIGFEAGSFGGYMIGTCVLL